MHEQTPNMYVFAGNNGSGKSTIRNLIVDRLGISVNKGDVILMFVRSLDEDSKFFRSQ
ncbi:MAG: hypothetical protein K0Q73_4789 [Paenibacillus sp.]|nr:hypothetical protein [Paenibacillus sp.]